MKLCYAFIENVKPSPFPIFLRKIGRLSEQMPVAFVETDDYEFHFVVEGQGTYTIDGKSYILSAGDCFFAKKDVKRMYKKMVIYCQLHGLLLMVVMN